MKKQKELPSMPSRYGVRMRIPVSARLRTSMNAVRQHLKNFRAFRIERDGNPLVYFLGAEGGEAYYAELGIGHIAVDLISPSPSYSTRHALVRLLCVAAVLEDHYEIGLRDIYPYLIRELGRTVLRDVFGNQEARPASYFSDIILARKINCLREENARMRGDLAAAKESAERALAYHLAREYAGTEFGIGKVSDQVGVGLETVRAAVSRMARDGTHVIVSDDNVRVERG